MYIYIYIGLFFFFFPGHKEVVYTENLKLRVGNDNWHSP